MTFDVVTLFPAMFQGPLDDGLLARARRSGRVAVRVHDLRRFGVGPQRQVDDAPFGGGPGMVLKPEPFFDAVAWIRTRYPVARERVILLSPQGGPFDQAAAARLAAYDRIVLLCGRYEGVDERVREGLADEEISTGDVVLTGGELPAMMVVDGVSRLVPGVLGNAASIESESFTAGGLDFPSYTRPAEFRGRSVPPVLLSGDHGAIARWREERATDATRAKRPDLISSASQASARRRRGTS
ncbi:MAG TPA: tRNA (guanosine(37)-N1)-methyltransferase TrmD [Candidatus Polarisedimenticolaceae bacterium]|nr:tRNA (guanosine(37)-N1)-methyltransferase TrmD [Candidatus Polarisedimenticolaceae bacterium]